MRFDGEYGARDASQNSLSCVTDEHSRDSRMGQCAHDGTVHAFGRSGQDLRGTAMLDPERRLYGRRAARSDQFYDLCVHPAMRCQALVL